jgi:hypothetical protein
MDNKSSKHYQEFDHENPCCSRCYTSMSLNDDCEWPGRIYVFCDVCKLQILIESAKKIIEIKQWCKELSVNYDRYRSALDERIEELENFINNIIE